MNNNVKLVRRGLKQVTAITFIILGIVTFPLPVPIGALLIASGLALLIGTNRIVARWIKERRVKTPSLNHRLTWLERKLPRFLSKPIRKTAPDYGHSKTKREGIAALNITTDVSATQK